MQEARSELDHAPIRVLVAEDSDLYRRGLVAVLSDRGFDVVAVVAHVSELLVTVERYRPQVILLDLELADGDSVPAIPAILEIDSEVKIVALAAETDRESVLRSLRAGAAGYLGKDQSPEGLDRSLRGVVRGEAPLSRSLASYLVEEVRREDRRRELAALVPDRDHLTPRQLEILKMLASGSTTAGIANELFLSVETVRWHIKSILRKLGVNSRAEAIACLEELQAV